jgi:FKBP-type peptidyl-prolyl cis-trans isomerase SlpA
MHFSLALTDGTPVECSFDNEPLTFVMGDGTLDTGLELALMGLRPGDRQTLTLMPGQAFGNRDAAAIQQLPLELFPAGIEPEPGQIIAFAGETGEAMPGAVLSVAGDQVEVDFNHPLAGREIRFEVHILRVENPSAA